MMRLTLRTLLAYLDDVLSPADTKVIGQKIQESPMAQLLVSRIREVMRRRRLKAPEVFGPEMGIDPNVVAQYLDNSLPPAQYADVERVLLASDEMLAETASCHQVLTMILGETKEISPESRDRLYALGPVETSSQLAVPMDTDLEIKSRTPQSISTRSGSMKTRDPVSNAPRVEDRTIAVPDYLKPAPLWKRLFPTLIVASLVIVCLTLFITDAKEGLQQAKVELQRKGSQSAKTVVAAGGKDDVAKPEPVVGEKPNEAKPAVVDATVVQNDAGTATNNGAGSTSNGVTKLPAGLDPTPPDDDPEVAKPLVATNSTKVIPHPLEGIPPSPPSTPMPEKSAVPPAGVPPIPAEILADLRVPYSSLDGVLVRRDPISQQWFVVPHHSELQLGERIANLEPFDGILDFEKAGVRATLVGECVLELLPPGPSGLQGMNIGRGRIVLQGRPLPDDHHPTIAIRIGEDHWKLELMSDDTLCAVEVVVRETNRSTKPEDSQWYQARVSVAAGDVRWTNVVGHVTELQPLSELNIVPDQLAGPNPAVVRIPVPPEWSDMARRKNHALRKYMSMFQSAFVKPSGIDRPVEEPMLTLVIEERNPKIAELAARCLSATDNYAGMVQTLAECRHEEARFAARDGLRQWLPMSPANGPNLESALLTHYPKPDADAIYQMLWGFTRDDVRGSTQVANQLTNWMRNPRPEIRELADFWVERLTGRATEYKALGAPTQRDAQIRRLEEQIIRNNGLIK